MYIILKTMLNFSIIACVIFAMLGFYSLDVSLISIGSLFALAGFILQLEMKDHIFNPFT